MKKEKNLPMTVMVNWLDPSFSAVSLALQVTVVMPTGKLSPDITTLPSLFLHTMVVESISPSTTSEPDGWVGQVMRAFANPLSTLEEILDGVVIRGTSLSVFKKNII